MRQSTRLVLNTAATFARMAVTVGLGLLTTRLMLQEMGDTDYGLLTALGASGALLAAVTQALIQSTQRHLAYEIGRGDRRQLSRVFSSAQVLFLLAGAVTWMIGFAATPLVLRGLTIPAQRLDAAWYVYQFTLIMLMLKIVSTPYESIIVAHQEIVFSTIFELGNSLVRLSAALALLFVANDDVVAFVGICLIGGAILTMLLVGFCLRRYPETRPRLQDVGRAEMRDLAGFAGWSFLGSIAWSLRQQGAMILLNVAFGPVVNAGYAIAVQVKNYASNLGMAIIRAAQPAIVTLHAKRSARHMQQLTLATGRYTFIILSLLFIPLWIEMPTVLDLWLDALPDATLELVRLTLVWFMIQSTVTGYVQALQATGNIGWWMRILVGLAAASMVLAIAAIYLANLGPWSVPASTIVLVCVQVPMTVTMIGRRIGVRPSQWIRKSLLPIVLATGPAAAAAAVAASMMPQTPWRVLVTIAIYNAIALTLTWGVGLDRWERQQFTRIAGAAIDRLRRRRPVAREQENESSQ